MQLAYRVSFFFFFLKKRNLAEYTGAVAVHVGLLAIEWNPFGDFPGVGKYEKLLLKYRQG